jgi:hypothetical protein
MSDEHVPASSAVTRDMVADGIQSAVEAGWVLIDYVTVAYFEKIESDGELHQGQVLFTPLNQPDHVTEGLLYAADRIRSETC